ncbi:MAG: hypothetical protein JO327_10235 [Nitrososphaeraceae archaeon]|nr:hypothetical protein [Nitrososphaeraceae archaeon]MBV9668494.1 hypothetical protein [Nitrososphaeraceae archaeon]
MSCRELVQICRLDFIAFVAYNDPGNIDKLLAWSSGRGANNTTAGIIFLPIPSRVVQIKAIEDKLARRLQRSKQ